MDAKKHLMRRLNRLTFFLVPIIPSLLILVYFNIMFGDKVEWITAIFLAIAPFYLFSWFLLLPYLRVKMQLSRMGYTCTRKEAFLFFYSGRSFEAFPAYEDISHHPEFSSNNTSCLISYLKKLEQTGSVKETGEKELTIKPSFRETLHRHPKRLIAYLIFMMAAFIGIGVPSITFAIDAYLQGKISEIPWLTPILTFAPIMAFFLLPDLISRNKLKHMGYSKTFQEHASIFFYTGSYFLPLPRHQEIATLSEFREDDIYSLIDIQIQMYEAKKGNSS